MPTLNRLIWEEYLIVKARRLTMNFLARVTELMPRRNFYMGMFLKTGEYGVSDVMFTY